MQKDAPYHAVRVMQIKQDATIQLLKGQKSGMLTTPNANEDVEQQTLSFAAGGNAKW